MLKQEKSRAAAAEASLQGASVTSNIHQKTVNAKEQKVEDKATHSSNSSHRDHHSQNISSSSNQLSEQQKTHRQSHKGLL